MKQEHYEGPERRRQAWHLDKKVPIVLFVILLGHASTTLWWAAELSSTVKEQAKAQTETIRRISEIEKREREGNKLVERVVRVETMLENVQHTVNRIDSALDERPRRK